MHSMVAVARNSQGRFVAKNENSASNSSPMQDINSFGEVSILNLEPNFADKKAENNSQ